MSQSSKSGTRVSFTTFFAPVIPKKYHADRSVGPSFSRPVQELHRRADWDFYATGEEEEVWK